MEKSNTNHKEELKLVYDGFEGVVYAKIASDIMTFRWIFKSILSDSEILLLIDLMCFKNLGDIFPSQEKLSQRSGTKRPEINQLLIGLAGNAAYREKLKPEKREQTKLIEPKYIQCPICKGRQKWQLLKIEKREMRGRLPSNRYCIDGLEAFLAHIRTEHYRTDVKKKNEDGTYRDSAAIEQEQALIDDFRAEYWTAFENREKSKRGRKDLNSFPKKGDDF
jgi:hypothetical protein